MSLSAHIQVSVPTLYLLDVFLPAKIIPLRTLVPQLEQHFSDCRQSRERNAGGHEGDPVAQLQKLKNRHACLRPKTDKRSWRTRPDLTKLLSIGQLNTNGVSAGCDVGGQPLLNLTDRFMAARIATRDQDQARIDTSIHGCLDSIDHQLFREDSTIIAVSLHFFEIAVLQTDRRGAGTLQRPNGADDSISLPIGRAAINNHWQVG